MNNSVKKLVLYVLIITGIVLSLALPPLLFAAIPDKESHYCREFEKYLIYSKDKLKTLREREIKLQNDQAEYAKMCMTAQAGS